MYIMENTSANLYLILIFSFYFWSESRLLIMYYKPLKSAFQEIY